MPVCSECVAEPKLGEFPHCRRLQIDADAKRREFAHRLIDPDPNASLMQAERKAQPADATTDNNDSIFFILPRRADP